MQDDLNLSSFVGELNQLAKIAMGFYSQNQSDAANIYAFYLKKYANNFLGLLLQKEWFKGSGGDNSEIQSLIDERIAAKKAKNWGRADEIRKTLAEQGIILEDKPDGTTDWRRE